MLVIPLTIKALTGFKSKQITAAGDAVGKAKTKGQHDAEYDDDGEDDYGGNTKRRRSNSASSQIKVPHVSKGRGIKVASNAFKVANKMRRAA